MPAQTEIFSIFGQLESIVAEAMIKENKAIKIEQGMIPPSQLYNDDGRKAFFAMAIPSNHLPEFERRLKSLRA